MIKLLPQSGVCADRTSMFILVVIGKIATWIKPWVGFVL